MDYQRITEISNPYCLKSGTGYLIRENLILTARHILTYSEDDIFLELRKSYDVRFVGDFENGKSHQWLSSGATLCWQSSDFDLALLILEQGRPAFITENSSDTQFGKLKFGHKALSAAGLGFPQAQRLDKFQDIYELRGNLSNLAAIKTNKLQLEVTSLLPDRPEKWKGISGTALFVDNYLAGIVTETDKGFAEKALRVVPIALVIEEDKEFCRLVFGEGNEPLLQSLPITGSQCRLSPDFTPSLPTFPAYNPKTFTGRETIIDDLLPKLQGQNRLVWITGISGIGKTTLGECLASWVWEQEPIFQWIYLEILEGQSPDFASVAADLWGKLGEGELDPQIRNNPEQVAKKLLQKLQTHPYWIQIDSLERLLDPEQTEETGFIDEYWVTFLRQCLTASGFKSHLVLTSQALPTSLAEFSNFYGNCWQAITLQGLVVDEKHNEHLQLFEKNGLNIDATTTVPLSRIGQIYEGHPLVLQVITGEIKAVPFNGDVVTYWQRYGGEFEKVARELEVQPANSVPRNQTLKKQVHRRIVKSLKQLPPVALDLLCRSAVYRRPVLETFWLVMIKERPEQEQQLAYEILGDRLLVEREGIHQGEFLIRQHNLIRAVAYDLLRENPSTWETAELQAADLWLTAYKPAADVPNLEKVRGYLEAFDHYCEISDWEEAKDILLTPLDSFGKVHLARQLLDWSLYQEGLQVCKKILKKSTHEVDMACFNMVGVYYLCLGNYAEAIKYCEQSLAVARELGDSRGEGIALGNLGLIYKNLGQYDRAINFHQQSLVIKKEIGDRRGEGNSLGNLGNAYRNLGQYDRAINFHQQRLVITREIGDRRGEGNSLGSLGVACSYLGQYDRAIDFLQQYLAIARETGDRQGEGIGLEDLGGTLIKVAKYTEALEYLQKALEIDREIGFRQGEAGTLKNLAQLHQALGDLDLARQYCQQALALAIELGIPLTAECETLLLKIENAQKVQPTEKSGE